MPARKLSTSEAEQLRAFERQGHDALAATYQEFFAPVTAIAIAPLLDGVGLRPGTHLLDVAAGPGKLTAAAASRGAQVIGAGSTQVSIFAKPKSSICRLQIVPLTRSSVASASDTFRNPKPRSRSACAPSSPADALLCPGGTTRPGNGSKACSAKRLPSSPSRCRPICRKLTTRTVSPIRRSFCGS
jgi:hypothetical protein